MNASDPIHAEPRSFRVPPAALGALLTSLFLSLHEFVFWTVAAAYQGYIANKSAHASEKSADAAKLAADTAAATLKHVTANDSATSAAALAAFKEEERAYISTTVESSQSCCTGGTIIGRDYGCQSKLCTNSHRPQRAETLLLRCSFREWRENTGYRHMGHQESDVWAKCRTNHKRIENTFISTFRCKHGRSRL